jgi:5-methyltetrahydropteroyltriglutamate--homocysteine methyltransferase
MTNHAQRLHNRDGRMCWVHPDCGFWMLKRPIADRKNEALVVGRDKYLGR